MEKLPIREILFEAFEYQLSAVPEFWCLKQKSSGWSVDTFYSFLLAEYEVLLQDRKPIEEKGDGSLRIHGTVPVGHSLSDLTNGKLKSAHTLEGHETTTLNQGLLDTMYTLITKSKKIALPAPTPSHLQLIEYAHTGLAFAYEQFKIQTGKLKPGILFGRSTSKERRGYYIFYRYSLFTDVPLFKFYTYRNSFRELLLNSTNKDPLIKIAEPVLEWCKEMIQMFNEIIQPHEEPFDGNEKNVGKATLIEKICWFDEETFDFEWVDEYHWTKTRTLYGNTIRNREIAEFAFRVAIFLSNEVLPKTGSVESLNQKKPSVTALALVHIYWSKYDATKKITKTNKKSFADEYSVSEITLFKFYNQFLDKGSRLMLPADKKEQKNSVVPFIENFEEAAKMLKVKSAEAYDDILMDLHHLKTRYSAYLP